MIDISDWYFDERIRWIAIYLLRRENHIYDPSETEMHDKIKKMKRRISQKHIWIASNFGRQWR